LFLGWFLAALGGLFCAGFCSFVSLTSGFFTTSVLFSLETSFLTVRLTGAFFS